LVEVGELDPDLRQVGLQGQQELIQARQFIRWDGCIGIRIRVLSPSRTTWITLGWT